MTDDRPVHRPPDGWPTPEPDQVRVMLLGLYHMDNPGLDAVNVQADDVLADERQAELRDLADRLEPWSPDRVAVERPYDGAAELNTVYEEYRAGDRAYDREEAFDSTHPRRDEPVTECRSEVVQVGFRLADRLGHDRVYPVDYPMTLGDDEDAEELQERGFEPDRKVPVDSVDLESHQQEVDERLATSTIIEYLRWLNRESQLRLNDDAFFDEYVRMGEGDNFAGPRAIAIWYDRNLRMMHNVWRAIESGGERVLLVVGSGHVHVLRRLFDLSPMFCPASPLPYLEAE